MLRCSAARHWLVWWGPLCNIIEIDAHVTVASVVQFAGSGAQGDACAQAGVQKVQWAQTGGAGGGA